LLVLLDVSLYELARNTLAEVDICEPIYDEEKNKYKRTIKRKGKQNANKCLYLLASGVSINSLN